MAAGLWKIAEADRIHRERVRRMKDEQLPDGVDWISARVRDMDVYDLGPLPTNPTSVHGLEVRAYARRGVHSIHRYGTLLWAMDHSRAVRWLLALNAIMAGLLFGFIGNEITG